MTRPAMRYELSGRKTPQKPIKLAKDFWLGSYGHLHSAPVGLAQKATGVQKLVGDVEMERDFNHARFLEACTVFLTGLGSFGADLAALLIAAWLIK